jgi:hypothetical protein
MLSVCHKINIDAMSDNLAIVQLSMWPGKSIAGRTTVYYGFAAVILYIAGSTGAGDGRTGEMLLQVQLHSSSRVG